MAARLDDAPPARPRPSVPCLGLGLDQPLNILLSRRFDRPGPLTKMSRETMTKGQEPLTHSGQHASGLRTYRGVFFNASEDVSFIPYLINLVF